MKKLRRITAIVTILILILSACPITLSASALSAGAEVKGNTVCQALGMDGGAYLRWLTSHEHDSYYLGTPYRPYDHRNPNGDCKGAYGYLDSYGVPGMNCMGFVWHVLYKATALSGGSLSRADKMAYGRLTFYEGLNISRKYFKDKQTMLKSGYLEKGDIIWMIPDQQEYSGTVYHHVGIYWGDGRSDVLWHSNTVTGGQGACNAISRIYPMLDRNTMYIVLKVGAGLKATPKLTAAYNTEKGINITWNKSPGVKRYRVFVKGSGGWKALGDTDKNYYTMKDPADGVGYTFTVRCTTATGSCYTSLYDKRGISCLCCPAPKVSCVNKRDGISLTWNKIKGAKSYRVYVKESGQYVRLGETPDTSYVYKAPVSNTAYTFTMRSVMSSGTPGAYKKDGFAITFIAPVQITAVNRTEEGVHLSWKKPEGALDSFRVFRKDSGEWLRLTDTTAGAGSCTYAVRCLSADKKHYLSAYEPVTINIKEEDYETI